ncbi:MAG: PLD nuclease N-terminal domain-containing protein [Candidatus Eisenbacteria bacterium]
MNPLIGLAVLVLDVVAIVDCLKRPMATGKKALWIILILVLPVVGMILYFLLGRRK